MSVIPRRRRRRRLILIIALVHVLVHVLAHAHVHALVLARSSPFTLIFDLGRYPRKLVLLSVFSSSGAQGLAGMLFHACLLMATSYFHHPVRTGRDG
jgi:hypothetical protein